MRVRRCTALAASLFVTLAAAAYGQGGGRLDAQTQYEIITGPGQNNQHGPLLAIVLWHGPMGWNEPHTPAERARSDSIFRWTRFAAEGAGQSFFGSGLWYGLLERDNRAVVVEGTRVALVAGDSARIIMVTVTPNNLPRIVTTAWIAAELPSDFWIKQWRSGDTTFFVHPDFHRQQAMLRAALAQSSAVAAFLR